MMIRVQGIDPKTCPAYAKFRLFVGLRRWVWIYFILHTFVIFLQFFEDMALWGQVVLFILWEIAQLVVTFLIGWLFKATGKTNLYLEREAHLPEEQVRRARPRGWPQHVAACVDGMLTQCRGAARAGCTPLRCERGHACARRARHDRR